MIHDRSEHLQPFLLVGFDVWGVKSATLGLIRTPLR